MKYGYITEVLVWESVIESITVLYDVHSDNASSRHELYEVGQINEVIYQISLYARVSFMHCIHPHLSSKYH